MAEETIITWNFTNWVTIVLMVALGFVALGFVAKVVKQRTAKAAD
jgi:hypothetical protein